MNLKKILLSSVAAAALTSGVAFAAGADDGSEVAVLANDGTGDYLVIPAYFANTAGWSTNIKVVNTNTTHAVVAKVVFRESVQSEEYLDFPIYLTPGDVWEGTVVNVGGSVTLTSSDDSMYSTQSETNTPVFADVTPVSKAFPTVASKVAANGAEATRQNPAMGYVEIYGIGAIDGTDVNDSNNVINGTTWTAGTKLLKKDLYAEFMANLNDNDPTDDGDWVAVDNNSLYAQAVIQQIVDDNKDLGMTIPALAFENVTGTDAIPAIIVAKDTDLVNSSNRIDKTLLINQIELALGKSDVYVTHYEDGSAMANTVLLMTQPMKKYRYDTGAMTALLIPGYQNVTLNTEFRATVNGVSYTNDKSGELVGTVTAATANASDRWAFTYRAIARDQAENTPQSPTGDQFSGFETPGTGFTRCNAELCYLNVGGSDMSDYAAGYVDVSLQGGTNHLPVIPTVMSAKVIGGTTITNIIYPAYKK